MLDVRGFVTPEQDFRGLNRLSEGVRYETQRDEEKARRENVRKTGNAAFLQGMLDPKDFLSGTMFDPNITKGINDLMEQGIQLSQTEGMDNATLQMSLMPAYRRLSNYSQKAKTIKSAVEGRLKDLPQGYNKSEMLKEALNAAFIGEDGNVIPMENIDQVDVEKDYIAEAVKRNPLGVTTGDIFSEAIKDFEVGSEKRGVMRQSATGARQRRMSLLKSRGVFDYDEDAGKWVPKYEIAKDGDKPQMGTFTNEKGEKVQAPIRMVPDDVFNKMVSSYPAIADRIRGEVLRINPNIDLNGPEARRLAKMLMYEELKPLATGAIEDIQETKAAPAPRINVNIGGGNAAPNTATQGNEFDRINVSGQGFNISNGYATTPDGKPFTGHIAMKRRVIPQGTLSILNAAGVPLKTGSGQYAQNIENFSAKFVDGQMVSLTPEGGNPIDRTDMENFQLKYNSEPQKGAQPTFGKRPNQPQSPKPQQQNQSGNVRVRIEGKVYEVPASALSQMDKDGVKYTKL